MLILDEPARHRHRHKLEIMELVRPIPQGWRSCSSSSEMSEVLRVQRPHLAVLRDRQKSGEIDGKAADEQSVFRMIAGTRRNVHDPRPVVIPLKAGCFTTRNLDSGLRHDE